MFGGSRNDGLAFQRHRRRAGVIGRERFFFREPVNGYVFEVIGEAVRHLSNQSAELPTSIPWSDIAGMRNILIHEYFGVDLALVWDVVERELPALRPRIAALVEVYVDAKKVFSEEYTEINGDVKLDPAVFDPKQFTSTHWEKP